MEGARDKPLTPHPARGPFSRKDDPDVTLHRMALLHSKRLTDYANCAG